MTDMGKVVLIMGHGHCGSTLISLVLATHRRVFGAGELQALSRRMRESDFDLKGACGICDGDCEVWGRIGRDLSSYFPSSKVESYIERMIPWMRPGIYPYMMNQLDTDIIVDNSKLVYWIRKQLSNKRNWQSIRPFVLYVVRDGRAVVNSYLRKYPGRPACDEITRWRSNTLTMNELFVKISGCKFMVRYEDFADNPILWTKKIFAQLEIEYNSEHLDISSGDHHILYSNSGPRKIIASGNRMVIKRDDRWRRELDPEIQEAFVETAGDVNRLLGYND